MQRRGHGGRNFSGSPRNSPGSWGRLKPVTQDPLEEFGLPSKGDDRLLIFSTQERFYGKIVERYMSFCTTAGNSTSLLQQFASMELPKNGSIPTNPLFAPPAAHTPNHTDLSHILTALRKLREGIVASKRTDSFALQAYLFAIRLGVLCKAPETYHPAILHLLRAVHPHHNLTTVELHEIVVYLTLDCACRRGEYAEAYALRNEYGLRDGKVDAVLRALVQDNWVALFRAKAGMDGHMARIVEFAEKGVRRHVLKAVGKSYLSVPVEFLEESMALTWRELQAEYAVGWELSGNKVIIRKIHGRS